VVPTTRGPNDVSPDQKDTITMVRITQTESDRNGDETETGWRDRAVTKLAHKYALPLNVAQVIAANAGLGTEREAA
jgi:hypothetical protein